MENEPPKKSLYYRNFRKKILIIGNTASLLMICDAGMQMKSHIKCGNTFCGKPVCA